TPQSGHDQIGDYTTNASGVKVYSPIDWRSQEATTKPAQYTQNGPVQAPQSGGMAVGGAAMPGSFAPPTSFAQPLIGGRSPYDWARRGQAAEMLGFPNIATPMMQAAGLDPNVAAAKTFAEKFAGNDLAVAQAIAAQYPPGSPQRAMADAQVAK